MEDQLEARILHLEKANKMLLAWLSALSLASAVLGIQLFRTAANLDVDEIRANKITLTGTTPKPDGAIDLFGNARPDEAWRTTISPGRLELYGRNYLGIEFNAIMSARTLTLAGPHHEAQLDSYQLHMSNEHESMLLFKAGLEFRGKQEVIDEEQGMYRRDGRVVIRAADKSQGRPLDEEGSGISIYDDAGKLRARLGKALLKFPDGREITSPESTLTLFDQEGRVEVQTPRRR